MLPELGHFALILGFALAIAAATFGFAGAARSSSQWMALCRSLVIGQLVFVAFSFAVLVTAFVQDDFTLKYVASNSNSLLPWQFKVSAVWGAHEGSFLLWIMITCVWMVAVALRSGALPTVFQSRVLGVMSLLNVGFIAFALFTSNPFERLLPLSPADGADLNPLLQDFGLIVHPPMLYVGYVGFAVPFSFAVAGLLAGRVDTAWARWSRPWANVAWTFLTIGIALGSWWAYYELGWGGWWFWDPVENASFMPWLAGTALVHSLAVSEKRGLFKSWTLLLAITAFSLSLLGAFIVRSGVLTSVHAFAVDPTRGMFILIFLALVVGGSLLLYAMRASTVGSRGSFSLLSREAFLLINNVIFVIALAVVLLGTLYPLAFEAVTGGKISVGKPWFNQFFVPLMLLLAVAVALTPVINWKRTDWSRLKQRVPVLLVASMVIGVALPLVMYDAVAWPVLIAVALSLWIAVAHLADLWRRVRPASGQVRGSRLFGLKKVPLAYLGMMTAHLGFAMSLAGVAVTSDQSIENDVRMVPGDSQPLGDYTVRFEGVHSVQGGNYVAQAGSFTVSDGSREFVLQPEKRRYLVSNSVMTEAAIDAGFSQDVYISLGEPLENGAWAVRLHWKPLVRWIWFGAVLMGLGGLIAVADKRYRTLRVRREQLLSVDQIAPA